MDLERYRQLKEQHELLREQIREQNAINKPVAPELQNNKLTHSALEGLVNKLLLLDKCTAPNFKELLNPIVGPHIQQEYFEQFAEAVEKAFDVMLSQAKDNIRQLIKDNI